MSVQPEEIDRGWPEAGLRRPEASGVAAETPVPLLNIANVLTMARIAIVPLFVLALFAGGGHDTAWRITATALFALAAITDRFDGQLARKYGLVTDFGKLADPIADKALIGAALIGLSVLGDVPWWITLVICGRELGITLLRLLVVRRGVIPAGRGGKLKTLVQSVAIGVLLLPLAGGFATAGMALMYVAVALTVVTGLDYVGQAARVWFAGGSARNRAA
ncbi:CDP-diacylglycerol--glycerol-3-phosphate 3-phosphatidyltransferase [Nocardia puris]|uniref:CDP-diacylglycerol--glycerol-3-phosphate 3-phosphatidyltransferase n=1 Tax=Nocardia puris TaxID=208602 RepID=A0A366E439_9NOCA|nr:CDP-diacylglycerol--glycerol-3-phosphate 3-phosphatidyltransferase [Nocardia puris]MBF6212624.1 CDP-diacylglycerol--glycerol-3-phosphate 3-phosphatidyltransferase [Nocardia puris]MBF6369204.1 CDP-diacylglycerol--glycerol-3-phosphate 3-phosphatidyltransferase [Nocardia puris]MBF6461213.1 CDP-diacylglycerol--glycerol-3-phosphate 3-phosphatidyltransferase [Nocardia puris]RBO96559.1 CDP-diacylglycerol--glycerol-3-phosphate 3-phosphatidyltransferase [Nocardia puris]